MKVSIYIKKSNFDNFYRWIQQLNLGMLSTPTVEFSHIQNEIEDPLRVTLDSREYYLITDAKEDLKEIEKIYGPMAINYEPGNDKVHLQRIKEAMRNADREDLTLELVYMSLAIMKDLPDITVSEAIIIAERNLLGNS